MTLDEALAISDSYQSMLEIACLLGDKAARLSQAALSREEGVVYLVTWLDCQVCNGGWEQWMGNTTVAGLRQSLPALREVGCTDVSTLAERALAAAGVDLMTDTDTDKREKLQAMPDSQRQALSQLDDGFYETTENCMALCKEYLVAHRAGFSL